MAEHVPPCPVGARPRHWAHSLRRAATSSRRRGSGVVAVAAFAAAACAPDRQPPAEPSARPAKLVQVAASDDRITVELPVVFEASAAVDLAFQTGGRVASIAVREGDTVSEGAEIARLDLREMRTEVAAAEARHGAAESEFVRARRLIAENAISDAAYEQRRAQFEVARTALEAAQRRLDDGVLRAPFGGVVAAIHAEAFQSVAPQARVATLQSDGAAEAVVQAPAALVANAARIETVIEPSVSLDAVPGVSVPGTLHSLAARADPATQTFEARIAFEPPQGVVVRPGMTGTVQATLAVAGADAGIRVPISAIGSEAGEQHVWVVDAATMTVSKRPVVVGEGIGDTVPVAAGLAAGETIVAAGVSFLHEGARVRRYEP